MVKKLQRGGSQEGEIIGLNSRMSQEIALVVEAGSLAFSGTAVSRLQDS